VRRQEQVLRGSRTVLCPVVAVSCQFQVGAHDDAERSGFEHFAEGQHISQREQEILRMLSAGLSNREITERYSISTSTVKTHIENIFRKLGVNTRTQAIAQAQMLDLV